jgi:hypothetical protein
LSLAGFPGLIAAFRQGDAISLWRVKAIVPFSLGVMLAALVALLGLPASIFRRTIVAFDPGVD